MKYLKAFEAKITSNEFYSEMQHDEFYHIIHSEDRLEFTKNETDIIFDITKFEISPFVVPDVSRISLTKKWLSKNYTTPLHFRTQRNAEYAEIDIFKLRDEWYYVSHYDSLLKSKSWYRCDQFDGLVRLLKEISTLYN